MKVVEITSFGGPDVLRLADRPVPVAGAGELLIRVAASGINRPDVLQRSGAYPPPPGASDLPGLEVAGVIESGDAQALAAGNFKVGDRVCALVAGGGYAEFCIAPVEQCLPVPKGLTDVEAASLPETFFTVWSNVFDRGRLQSGEVLLVQGGVQSEINAGLVLRKRLTITGSTLRPRPVAFKKAIAQACLARVWPLLEAGRIKPVIHSVFAAAEASKAHALMETNQHVGKIVLTWGAV
jgi:NADPH:quinone reductase-like Zn-dependent oxidoreductase